MKKIVILVFCLVAWSFGWEPAFSAKLDSSAVSRGGLPRTGQTTLYQRGDDSTYKKGYAGTRFTNNGDGTIIDNATGLMWVADITAAGVGGPYTWKNAITACEDLIYAGYSDWRLPNIKELASLVDYGRYNPAIDTNFFASNSYLYWSSTTYANSTSIAWGIYFFYGIIHYYDKASPNYVRPVRGGQ